jgi:hypothetical protein
MPLQNSASAMRFTSDSYKTRQKPCDALNFAPACCRASDLLVSTCCKHVTGVPIFASERYKIITRFSAIIPDPANVMQFADVSFALMQILRDGKVRSNELMLHKTMQCTGASCKVHQNAANTEQFCANTTQPRDFDAKGAINCTLIYLAFGFWPFHSREGTVFTLYIYWFCTEGCLHAEMPSHMNAFMQRCFSQRHVSWCFCAQMPLCPGAFTRGCFYTQELLHTDAQVFLHTDALTQRCFFTGMIFHTSTCALARGFF